MNGNFDEVPDILPADESELNNVELEIDFQSGSIGIDSFKVPFGVFKKKTMIQNNLPGHDGVLEITKEY